MAPPGNQAANRENKPQPAVFGETGLLGSLNPDYRMGIGFFAYSVGGIIHILLIIALIAVIFRVIQRRKIL